MCVASAPKVPSAPVQQEAQAADLNQMSKLKTGNNGMAGGSLLTSPSGIALNALTSGGASLLGG